jgi:hypothetical protein
MERKIPLSSSPSFPLPQNIVARKKTGFSLPMGKWLEKTEVLDEWRNKPSLLSSKTHWSKRMAYSLAKKVI